jgi:hypothetical protein
MRRERRRRDEADGSIAAVAWSMEGEGRRGVRNGEVILEGFVEGLGPEMRRDGAGKGRGRPAGLGEEGKEKENRPSASIWERRAQGACYFKLWKFQIINLKNQHKIPVCVILHIYVNFCYEIPCILSSVKITKIQISKHDLCHFPHVLNFVQFIFSAKPTI